MKKTCKKCNVEKSLSAFSKQRTNKDGYKGTCKLCINEYYKNYRDSNIEKELERTKSYYKNNKEKKKEYVKSKEEHFISYRKQYNKENKISITDKKKIYYSNNKEKVKKRNLNYYNNRLKNDSLFKFKKTIKDCIRDSFRRLNLRKNNLKTTEILGCSFEDFKTYIESKFELWMNWENKGLFNAQPKFGWDIDHIIPISTAKTIEDVIRLNHYTNLQPLCSYTNRIIKRNSTSNLV